MIKQFIFSAIFYLISSTCLYSQPYVPMLEDSSIWFNSYLELDIETNIIIITPGDTLINNNYYKMLMASSCSQEDFYSRICYLREDKIERKIYLISLNDEDFEEKLLYDFNLDSGDTFDVYNHYDPTLDEKLVLKSIYDTTFFDRPWKIFSFHNGVKWAEGFGSLAGFFKTNYSHTDRFTTSGGYFLSCYYKNSTLMYQTFEAELFNSCCISTSIENLSLPQWFKRVYPSPFRDKISIDLQTTCTHTIFLSLVDVTGKEMYRVERKVLPGTETFTLENLGHFNPGMYLLKGALDGEKSFAVKVFKQ